MREVDSVLKDVDARTILGKRRLVLVSNREPYIRKRLQNGQYRLERTTGGLVTALEPVMRQCGGVWVAWNPGHDSTEEQRYEVPNNGGGFSVRQVPLTATEVRRYYHGFANRALWPLFHYFIDRCFFDESEWGHYVKVNERFADAVHEETRPGDLIWVHDYHLCLLPDLIRNRQGSGPIAFFLHVPFPTEEVFKILPWRRELVQGLVGADLVGFQTPRYAGDFLGCCDRILGARVDHDRGVVEWGGRKVRVADFPIGIDVREFEKLARSPEVSERARRIRQNLRVEKLVLGMDRLDYSKGILERLHAIDLLFQRYPEHRGRTGFLQVAVPSRTRVEEYRTLKHQIDEMVGRINGQYGGPDWQPIRYLYRSLPRAELVAYYRAADIALVTPLRDGMNLVCMEYCASRVDGDGVLVLSEFTGAAEFFESGALMVNPFGPERVAECLHEGLKMERPEAERRMAVLRKQVAAFDVHGWLTKTMTTAIRQVSPEREERARAES